MKVITEISSLDEFGFWSGGEEHYKELDGKYDSEIMDFLEELYPDGIDETTLNDIFWHEFDWLCESAGIPNPYNDNDEEDEDEDYDDEDYDDDEY